jgi:uncharacterized protein
LLTGQSIRNAILPRFKRGEFAEGIKVGVRDIRDVMLGDAEAVKQRVAARPMAKRDASNGEALVTLLFIAAIVIFVLWAQSQQARQPLSGGRYGRRAGYGGGPIFFPGDWSGGGRRGGGGDGGGFSGGGGDFGGGGASGDW